MAASGMLPSGEERPAGSSRAPVGRRAFELSDAGMPDGFSLSECEGAEQPARMAAARAAAARRLARNLCVGGVMFPEGTPRCPRPTFEGAIERTVPRRAIVVSS